MQTVTYCCKYNTNSVNQEWICGRAEHRLLSPQEVTIPNLIATVGHSTGTTAEHNGPCHAQDRHLAKTINMR